jgi:1-hydroxycarotenoid 3,4-desaturase
MAEIVVVGAGMGGLAAAIRLAAAGRSVTVLEAAPIPGGKVGEGTVDGVAFDTGPSLLTLPEVLDDLFRTAGSSLADELTLRTPDPAFRYLWPDGTRLDLHPDPADSLDSVRAALGAEAAEECAAFLAYARRIWEAAAPHFVFGPAPSLRRIVALGPAGAAALTHIDPLRRMRPAIERRVRSPHLRDLFTRFATYNGSDPRRAPATLNCIAHVELGLGGHGVEGGMGALVRALVRTAERLGVEIRCGERVTAIARADGAALVHTAGGTVHRCRGVVVNADASHLSGELLPRQTSGASGAPSMSGWTAVVRARRRPEGRPAHAVLFPGRDYLEEFVDIFDRDRPPREPAVYLCAQEGAHGRAGWPEHEPLFLMANAPAEPASGVRPGETWTRLREVVLARARAAGLIDPDDEIVWERTPGDLARRFPGSRGALYGAASNSPLAAFRRPANRAAPGVYLASGSAHPGGGVPLCLLSGRAAATAAMEDLA